MEQREGTYSACIIRPVMMVLAPKKSTKREALQERHAVTSLMTFAPEV